MPVDQSAVARVVGILTQFRRLRGANAALLPQRIAVIAQGASASSYSLDKFQITSHGQAGQRYGRGSPIHLISRMLFPDNGDGVGTIPVTVYPLEDNGDGVAATGSISATGTVAQAGTGRVRVGGVWSEVFVIAADDTLEDVYAKIGDAINAVLHTPMIASVEEVSPTAVDLAAKWAGETGNDITVQVDVPDEVGLTFDITQPSGGLANPDIQPALDIINNVWETVVINALGIDDTTALDALHTFNEGRWDSIVTKPFVAFCGTVDEAVNDAISVTSNRPLDRTTSLIPAPGSVDLPLVVAARGAARVAKEANNNPPVPYAGQRLTQVDPGSDTAEWNHTQRDQALKGGCSTVEKINEVLELSQVVTPYSPAGEVHPGWRYVRDIMKDMNILFNIRLIFESSNWKGTALIPDLQVTSNPRARKPRNAVSALHAMWDALGENAIIADAEFAKESTSADISGQNPNRLDIVTAGERSGGTDIVGVSLSVGHYFGGADAA